MRLWSAGATEENSPQKIRRGSRCAPHPWGVRGSPGRCMQEGAAAHTYEYVRVQESGPRPSQRPVLWSRRNAQQGHQDAVFTGSLLVLASRNNWAPYQEGKLYFLPCVQLLRKRESMC